MWLEMGNKDEGSGFSHVVQRHQNHYKDKNIPAAQQTAHLPILAEASTQVGRHVGWVGAKRDRGRPVMATYYMTDDGKTYRNAMTIGDNGYVFSAQPISQNRIRRHPGEPGEVSDKTMENLYYYPPNHPERRSTHEVEGSQKVQQS